MEAIQTPEPVTVRRHKKSVADSDDRLRMDGTRHYHGVHQCTTRIKSAEAGQRFSQDPRKILVDIASSVGGRSPGVEISPRLAVCTCGFERCKSSTQARHVIIN